MAWQARWRHISQLYRHPGDAPGVLEGASDCFEVSLARYLREQGYPFAGDDAALVGAMRLLATGRPDHAGQGWTTLEQGGRTLDALGVGWRWTGDLAEARGAAWAIYWVRAAQLRRPSPNAVDGCRVYTDYPLSWLGDHSGPDHFILQLPGGAFNDPLSYWNGGNDTVYTPTSVAAAFGGAYVLTRSPWVAREGSAGSKGGPGGPGSVGSTAGRDPAALVVACREGVRLRQAPTLTATVLATLQDGEGVRDAYAHECLWTFVRARGQHGWVRREYVRSSQ
jgi:hypothetical protein